MNLPLFAGNHEFNDQIGHGWQSNLLAQLATALSLNSKGCGFESYWNPCSFSCFSYNITTKWRQIQICYFCAENHVQKKLLVFSAFLLLKNVSKSRQIVTNSQDGFYPKLKGGPIPAAVPLCIYLIRLKFNLSYFFYAISTS